MTIYYQMLMPGTPYNFPYKQPMPSYGPALVAGKARVNAASLAIKLPPERRALMIAMAMIETNHLDYAERDKSKDHDKKGAANVSLFNINMDLLRELGCVLTPSTLNLPNTLSTTMIHMNQGIDWWGIYGFLDFVRGGRKAFKDHQSYGATDYRRAVATALTLIDGDPALLSDDRRIEMNVPHQ
jgi:hypothetical protein